MRTTRKYFSFYSEPTRYNRTHSTKDHGGIVKGIEPSRKRMSSPMITDRAY